MSEIEALKKEREDWDALVQSTGWLRLMGFVKLQYGSAAYQQRIEKAIEANDLSTVRVVTEVRKQLEIILNRPAERMKELAKAMEPVPQTPSRRGTL